MGVAVSIGVRFSDSAHCLNTFDNTFNFGVSRCSDPTLCGEELYFQQVISVQSIFGAQIIHRN